ncbi:MULTISPECIES: TetR/AcrR family transcriptional regulator [Sphingomonas]|uniref:TetR/AcrR family transcriptional regulator n=1 Tax=Sphingomonas TaxID=13687 RepID=UPI0018DBF8CE|nr:TetR/AcrR family transcriptional regulator [Sphingomonas sp. CGMCC 1.13658]
MKIGEKGRARSGVTTDIVREAALALAREFGPGRVTVEGISTASGVAKTTIYRRWPNAAALIMDAFLDEIGPVIAYRPTATLIGTFSNALHDLARALTPSRREMLRHLVAAAQSDPDLGAAFWENWIKPRREEALRAIQPFGVARDEGDILLDLLFGAFYYRMLIPYAAIDSEWIDGLVERVFLDDPKPATELGGRN